MKDILDLQTDSGIKFTNHVIYVHRLNEDAMETLFGCNSVNSVPKEATRKVGMPSLEQENRVLDPKKSQNIAILLRALNVTTDEVTDALLDGM